MESDQVLEESSNDFAVIGSVKRAKPVKTSVIRPRWFENAIPIEAGDIQSNLADLRDLRLPIHDRLLELLCSNGFHKLFPVQSKVIPHLLQSMAQMKYTQPRDVCVLSPTGSGKTLAYIVPIVNNLLSRVVTHTRALVILPVSDLATQVYHNFQSLTKGSTLRVALASGSGKLNTNNYLKKRVDGSGYLSVVDILVATPGKLMELIHLEGFTLQHLEILVIDEADRMMNETQFDWLEEIKHSIFNTNTRYPCKCGIKSSSPCDHHNIDALSVCSISAHPQVTRKFVHKIVLSATLDTDPEKLESVSLYEPIMFGNTAASIPTHPMDSAVRVASNLKEQLVIIDADVKPLALWYLIREHHLNNIVCFTDSIESTHRLYSLVTHLKDEQFKVVEFSSKLNIRQRSKMLAQFKDGHINMIICTDIFARGLDLSNIACVVCYDPARNDTAYIHRVGRTARAGQGGTAISLITPPQLKHFNILSRRVHRAQGKLIHKLKISEAQLKPLLEQYKTALSLLEANVHGQHEARATKRNKQIKRSKFSAGNDKKMRLE